MNQFNILCLFKPHLEKGKNLKLKKHSIYNNRPIFFKQNILKKVKKAKITKGLYGKFVKCFIETLINRKANFDFTILKKNIKSLNVLIFDKPNTPCSAYYDSEKNIIYIQEKLLESYSIEVLIYHELMHMLSNTKRNKFQHVGFCKERLFVGINEGYTQVLTRRYFDVDEGAYVIEEKIALLLEFIVGKSLMENFYSKADCIGLIEEISNYNDGISSSYSLLSDIDIMHKLNPFLWENSIISIDKFIKEVRSILIEIITLFINKKAIEKNDDYILEFFDNVSFGIKNSKGKYKIFDKDEIYEYKIKCFGVIDDKLIKFTR